jgi:hypothetical protein
MNIYITSCSKYPVFLAWVVWHTVLSYPHVHSLYDSIMWFLSKSKWDVTNEQKMLLHDTSIL